MQGREARAVGAAGCVQEGREQCLEASARRGRFTGINVNITRKGTLGVVSAGVGFGAEDESEPKDLSTDLLVLSRD